MFWDVHAVIFSMYKDEIITQINWQRIIYNYSYNKLCIIIIIINQQLSYFI